MAGCAPGSLGGGEDGATETGDGATTTDGGDHVWTATRCVEQDGAPVCYGLPRGSSDAWVIVVPTCLLEEAELAGVFMPANGWGDGCAQGEYPLNFLPDAKCYTFADHSLCYSGGAGWWAYTQPACDAKPRDHIAWGPWMCDGAAGIADPGPWDSIGCGPDASLTCAGSSGDTFMSAWPTCWLDQFPAADPPC